MNIDGNWTTSAPTRYRPFGSGFNVKATSIAPNGSKTDLRTAAPVPERHAPRPVEKSLARNLHLYRRIESELPFLRRAARRWYRDRDRANADDLIQDTVLQALAKSCQWEAGSDLRAWLYTIMRNRFFAAAAKSKRSDAVFDVLTGENSGNAISPPDARLLMRDLERALCNLPPNQQIVVQLVGIEGRSYDEAAKTLRISVPAVRCNLARARSQLRRIMSGGAASQPLCHHAKV